MQHLAYCIRRNTVQYHVRSSRNSQSVIPQILSTLSMSTTLAVVGLAAGVVVGLQPGVATLPHVLEAALVLAAVGLRTAGRLPAGLPRDVFIRRGKDEGVCIPTSRSLPSHCGQKENAPYTLPKRLDAYLSRLMEYNVPKGKLYARSANINTVKEISAATASCRRAIPTRRRPGWRRVAAGVLPGGGRIMDESETRRGQL